MIFENMHTNKEVGKYLNCLREGYLATPQNITKTQELQIFS